MQLGVRVVPDLVDHLEGDRSEGPTSAQCDQRMNQYEFRLYNQETRLINETWFSPLVLRHCFEGSGASWARSGSADSAVAGGGCGTGGGAAQHLHLDPLENKAH